jgi:hypothetical protein
VIASRNDSGCPRFLWIRAISSSPAPVGDRYRAIENELLPETESNLRFIDEQLEILDQQQQCWAAPIKV